MIVTRSRNDFLRQVFNPGGSIPSLQNSGMSFRRKSRHPDSFRTYRTRGIKIGQDHQDHTGINYRYSGSIHCQYIPHRICGACVPDILSSTFQYTCTITTNAELSNVTVSIPVPADPVENSPIVAHYSSQDIKGRPADWDIILFDTGKATMAKITTAAIIPPENTSVSHSFTIKLSIVTESEGVIFRPVRDSRMSVPLPRAPGIGEIPCALRT